MSATSPIAFPYTRVARTLLLGTVVLLAACETTPEVAAVDDPEQAFAERLVRLAAIESWSAIGKLGIKSDKDSWSAGIQWHQSRDVYGIRLTDPLGQGLMELQGEPGLVELRTSDDRIYRAATAEELMQRHAGWQVPLTGLRHWILGRPDPEAPVLALELDPGGRPAEIRQLGWLIRFERYDDFDGIALPTKLSMENPRVRGKLIVRSWRTQSETT